MAGLEFDRILYAADTDKFPNIIDWYKTVFGVTFQKIQGGTELWFDPDGQGPGDHIISPHKEYLETWVPLVKVESVAAAIKKLPSGQTPLIGATKLSDGKYYAVFQDPAGAKIGVLGQK